MAPNSSTLAWKISWMEEPGRLQSMGSHRVGHNWSDLAAAADLILNKSLITKLDIKILQGQTSVFVMDWIV